MPETSRSAGNSRSSRKLSYASRLSQTSETVHLRTSHFSETYVHYAPSCVNSNGL